MKKLKGMLCILLCAVLSLGSMTGVVASESLTQVQTDTSVDEGPLEGINSEDYVVMSFTENSSDITVSELVKGGAADYEYTEYNGLECVKVNYKPTDESKWNFTVNAAFKEGGRIGGGKSLEYKYMVLLYAAKADVGVNVLLHNTGNSNEIAWFSQNTIEDGEWKAMVCETELTETYSERLNKANTIVVRMNAGSSEYPLNGSEEFYIRELVFFKNKADADSYAAEASSYYNGEAETAEPADSSTDSEKKLKLMMLLIGAFRNAREDKPEDEVIIPEPTPFDGIDENDYVIMSFAKDSTDTEVSEFEVGGTEDFTYVDDYKGLSCLKINYKDKGWNYSANVKFKNGGVLGGGASLTYKYMVLLYAAKSTVGVNVLFHNTGNSNEPLFFKNDKEVGNGEWKAAQAVMTTTYAQRLNQANNIVPRMNAFDNNKAPLTGDEEFYIRELVFFKNKDDANKYMNFYNNADSSETAE
ncbi:MAG: hypothetical protein IJ428_03015 [Clostridia bacterium]|nr:hypothetical protein [Clostridia bacterium]